jgi:hypothetical protein
MIIAFLLALIMEVTAEAKTVGRVVAYVLLPVILSLIVNTLFALIMPEEAATMSLSTAFLQRFGAAIIGLVMGKIVRVVTIGKR